jgi:alpha-ketoglutarate-dependent taurine dioxygenase
MSIIQEKLSDSFGLVIKPGTDTNALDLDIKEISDLFQQYRTLYFKGWNFTLEDFQEFSKKMSGNFSSYEGGGFRFKALDREFVSSDKTTMTTTGHTQGFAIPLHGEMHYMGTPPPLIWFYCKTPGQNTGQTTVCDGYKLAQLLPENVKMFFADKKIKYSRFLPDGSWQSSFLTEDTEKAMEICRQQKVAFTYDDEKKEFQTEYMVSPFPDRGYIQGPKFISNMLNIAAVEWAFESGWVKKNFDSDLGERCPMIVRMEDGSRIPAEILEEIRTIADSITINIEWEAGEVVMIDNLSVMHGRRESLNQERQIFVRMGDANF